MNQPIKQPAVKPENTASGNEDGGSLKPIPEMKTTASIPSRRTVMKVRLNIAYLTHHLLKRVLAVPCSVLYLDSIALASLTCHLACSFDTLSKPAPMMEIMMDAIRAKLPSQMLSVPAQRSLPAP